MTERVKKYLSILELSYCSNAISFRHSEMDFLFYSKMEKEIFKDIKGFEGLYQISNLGNVKSFKGKEPRLLKPRLNCMGYYHVTLSNSTSARDHNIHRLIGLHFIPNPQNKAEVNHIDGNRGNYNISNLEWMTHAENIKHGKHLKGIKSKFTDQDIVSIQYIYKTRKFRLREVAEIFNCSISAIHIIGKGKKWNRPKTNH